MTTTEKTAAGVARSRTRSDALDAFRGLAIVLMIVDHVTKVGGGPLLIRDTVGRLAMPMFFLLAGHLSKRLSRRHAGVFVVGLVLPVVVPWIDDPNVLCWYVAGAIALWSARLTGFNPVILVAVPLGLAANGPGWLIGWSAHSYWGYGLVALMVLGSRTERQWFTWTARLPARFGLVLAAMGRAPVRWYVGHLLVLELVGSLWVGGWYGN